MPLWTIYHTPNIFTGKEKSALANSITEVYTAVGLPRFYVITVFKQIEPADLYVGGERTDSAVRIVVDHIARTLPDKAARERHHPAPRRGAGTVSQQARPALGIPCRRDQRGTLDDQRAGAATDELGGGARVGPYQQGQSLRRTRLTQQLAELAAVEHDRRDRRMHRKPVNVQDDNRMVTGRHLGLDGSLDPGRGAADEHGTGLGGRSIQSGEPITGLGRQRPCGVIV